MKRKILTTILAISMLAGIITSLPVLAVSAAEHFVSIYQAEDSLVEPQRNAGITQLTSDGIKIMAGTAGNAVWGPYVALEAGSTKVTIRMRCPDVTFGGTTGVVADDKLAVLAIYKGAEVVATAEASDKFLPQFGAGEYINFEFNFTATAGTYNSVVFTTGKKELFLDSVTFDAYKTPSSPALEHTTNIYQAEDPQIEPQRNAGITQLTSDGIKIIAGTAGNAVWGPYVPLQAGTAKVTIRLRCPDVTFGGTTGVVADDKLAVLAIYKGAEVVATAEASDKFLPQFGAGEYINFEFNFTATAGTYNSVVFTTGKKELILDSVIFDLSNPVSAPTSDPGTTTTVTPTVAPIVTSAYPIHYDFQGVRETVSGYPHEIQSNMYFAPYTQFTSDGIVIPQGNQGNFIWGPYKNDLAPGTSYWTFKMKVDDNVPTDENVDSRFMRLVVLQKLSGGDYTEFKSIDDVFIDDFQQPNVFQDFTIEVPITAGAEYQMAVYSAGFKTVTMKSIDIDDSMPEVPVNTTQYPVVYDFQGERELISGYPHEIRSNLYFAPYVEFTADGVVVPQGKQGNFAWGPYVTTLPAKTTYWKFRLKVDNNEPSDENIDLRFMRIVVLQKLPEGSEAEFKSIDDVFIDDFETSDTFQDFVIEVPITEGAQYSFAIYSAGFKTVTFNSMTITDVNPNDETEITPTPTTTEEPTITEEPTTSESEPEGEIPETGDNNMFVLLAIIVSGLTLLMITKKRTKSIVNN